jgi:uncharacterized protein
MLHDSELPQIELDTVHVMVVAATESLGAFLHTGEDKQLLLPRSEQIAAVETGDTVIVYIKEDQQLRPLATEKFEKILIKKTPKFTENQAVELLIYAETDLGYKAVIDRKAIGILYKNEVFQRLHYGQSLPGFIKKIREDGKIDLNLRAPGHKATEDISLRILEFLEDNQGFFALTDKTPPEKIYELFGVSKKKFKIALGGLYKQRLITVTDQGVSLLLKTH